jgi:16S rRNA G1207 methylase RsmC
MKFPYSDSVAEKLEAVVGRQFTDAEYEAVKCIVENAAENFAEEVKNDTIRAIQEKFNSIMRRTA